MDSVDIVTEIGTEIQNENVSGVLDKENDGILEEPVEILVQLAKRGEIDPWNIDIVDITDKFLRTVEEMEVMDLRISGRTLHYAAILLRMKSEYLVEEDADDEEMEDDDDFFDDFDVTDYPIPQPPVRRKAVRPVTLQELIEELNKAEMVSDKRRSRKENKARRRVNITTEDVLKMAHDENIESSMVLVQESLENMFKNKALISFSDITGNSDMSDIPGESLDKVTTFISLLFLASRRKIWLEQEEMFGELYIRPWSPECFESEVVGEMCN